MLFYSALTWWRLLKLGPLKRGAYTAGAGDRPAVEAQVDDLAQRHRGAGGAGAAVRAHHLGRLPHQAGPRR